MKNIEKDACSSLGSGMADMCPHRNKSKLHFPAPSRWQGGSGEPSRKRRKSANVIFLQQLRHVKYIRPCQPGAAHHLRCYQPINQCDRRLSASLLALLMPTWTPLAHVCAAAAPELPLRLWPDPSESRSCFFFVSNTLIRSVSR